MAISDELTTQVQSTFKAAWTRRDGSVVPSTADIKLGNDGVDLDAVILYADLSESTKLVDSKKAEFAAEIYKNYLHCAARLIRHYDGSVKAYDGDRVMGVFIGNRKNTNAVRTALAINWCVQVMIQAEMKKIYTQTDYKINHTVGVDSAKLMVARTGVRGDNDLVWVGRAANWAAKLTTLPSETPLWITKRVYDVMLDEVKLDNNGKNMWVEKWWTAMNNEVIYCSSYRWMPA